MFMPALVSISLREPREERSLTASTTFLALGGPCLGSSGTPQEKISKSLCMNSHKSQIVLWIRPMKTSKKMAILDADLG